MTDTTITTIKRVLVAVILGGIVVSSHMYMTKHEAQSHEQRKAVVCPSFLSIARSPRDTLIVMRNEPLCNRYVLDNLK
jgi:hypothetical protein